MLTSIIEPRTHKSISLICSAKFHLPWLNRFFLFLFFFSERKGILPPLLFFPSKKCKMTADERKKGRKKGGGEKKFVPLDGRITQLPRFFVSVEVKICDSIDIHKPRRGGTKLARGTNRKLSPVSR